MTSQQIQYGGRLPYWKQFFGYISTIYHPINAKFGKKHNHVRHKSRDQNTKFRKFKMADGRHFENVFCYISAENHPISTKFCVQMQILVPITATLQNNKILQMKYGGWPTYWKSFFSISQQFIVRPINTKFGMEKQDNVRHRSRDQNAKFLKFKMADGRHL